MAVKEMGARAAGCESQELRRQGGVVSICISPPHVLENGTQSQRFKVKQHLTAVPQHVRSREGSF